MKPKLKPIEKAALLEIAKEEGLDLASFAAKLEEITVIDRWFSGAGFFVEMKPDEHSRLFPEATKSPVGSISICGYVNHPNWDVGYLVFLKDGYADCLECYTYTPFEWPEEIFEYGFGVNQNLQYAGGPELGWEEEEEEWSWLRISVALLILGFLLTGGGWLLFK